MNNGLKGLIMGAGGRFRYVRRALHRYHDTSRVASVQLLRTEGNISEDLNNVPKGFQITDNINEGRKGTGLYVIYKFSSTPAPTYIEYLGVRALYAWKRPVHIH